MKNVCSLILITLMIASCGYVGDGSCAGECSTNPSADTDDRINVSRLAVYTADDDFIGYATDYHYDYIKMYIPAYLSYVTIHPLTGEYLKQPASPYEEIYFTGLDCTGDAVMLNWSGKIGSTYILAKNDKTYQIQSTTQYSINNRLETVSRLKANRPIVEACTNSNFTVEIYVANLVETAAMVDLSPYAPFQMFQAGE